MSARVPQPCEGVAGEHAGRARFYRTGWRCNSHSPWAEAGQDEPLPGPGLPAGAWETPSPLSESRVADARAVASGKRRSNPAAYRAAQAAVAEQRSAS